ncbi:MAG: hypothetical protein HC880_07765 [Bacteroidia bacterium]|nr:hypothetical protein [Bacteroidia bacterium]
MRSIVIIGCMLVIWLHSGFPALAQQKEAPLDTNAWKRIVSELDYTEAPRKPSDSKEGVKPSDDRLRFTSPRVQWYCLPS